MTDFLAGFYGGVALGWIVSQLFSRWRRVRLIRSCRRHSNLLELPPLPRLDPGRVQRGNGHGGPTTPKLEIVPTPQGVRLIRLDRNLSPRENPGDLP